MKTTYTLIVGDAWTDDDTDVRVMRFSTVDSIGTYDSLDAAMDAGEAALEAGHDSWCIPETFDGRIVFGPAAAPLRQLQAAAPELLNALQRVINLAEIGAMHGINDKSQMHPYLRECLDAARAAIAKATGGQA